MCDALLLWFFEITQHCVAKAPLLVELGIFVFRINGFRLLELVIEKVRMGEVAFDKYWSSGDSSRAFKEAAIGLPLPQSVFDRPWFVARPIER